MQQKEITKEAFDELLFWLDPDREAAGLRYETIRSDLLKIFNRRGYPSGEDLADETINRVIMKVSEVRKYYEGDPALYFYGVAKKVMREEARLQARAPSPVIVGKEDDESFEREFAALEECLARLTPKVRRLIVAYYAEEKAFKFEARRTLAEEWKLSPGALRVRAHRIRLALHRCIERKLAE